MKAAWNGQVVAESDAESVIEIEENCYFPPDSIREDFFEESNQTSVCPWKGTAHYKTLVVDGKRNEAAAWYYPDPKQGASDRVGRQFRDYISFWNGVDITS